MSLIHNKIDIYGRNKLFIEDVIVLELLIFPYLTVLELISNLHHRVTLIMNTRYISNSIREWQ